MKHSLVLAIAACAALSGCAGDGISVASVGPVSAPAAGSFSRATSLRNGVGLFGLTGVAATGRGSLHPFVDSTALAREKMVVAVSDTVDNVVTAYDPTGKALAILTGFNGPVGLASDIKGDLYVADQGNNRVLVYPAGLKGGPRTLADAGEYPLSVDSFGNGQFVAVVNQFTDTYGPGSVTIYTKGVAGAPITSAGVVQMSFDAFDAYGNLFVDGSTKTGGFVGEIANATRGGTTLAMLSTSNTISPGGIQITNAGKIAILDQNNNNVDTYDPPVRGSLGSPISMTPLGGSYASIPFAFTKDMKHLYTTNYNDDNLVLEYAYPAGGGVVSSFYSEGSYPFGVAIIPTQHP